MQDRSLPKAVAIAEQGIERRLHTGMQISVRLKEEFFTISVGEASSGVAVTGESVFPWLSAAKPITSLAILQFVDDGKIGLDNRVADYIPEFARHGKESITIQQLLTHTAGLQMLKHGWPAAGWEQIIENVCDASLKVDWDPDKRAAYDPSLTWFVLGEILQRITGQDYAAVIDERVLSPIGMHKTQVAFNQPARDNAPNETALNDRVVTMYERQAGQLVESDWNRSIESPTPSPGSSLRGTTADLQSFYFGLLKNSFLDGTSILSNGLHVEMTRRLRQGRFDETLQHTVDYGLGVIIDSNQYGIETVPYGFGKHCSKRTFGHGGSQCSIGFADPGYNLAVAVVANGRPGEGQHQKRFRAICTAIYEDLGLV